MQQICRWARSLINTVSAFIHSPHLRTSWRWLNTATQAGGLMNKHDVFQMAYVSVLMALIGLLAWLLSHGVDQVTASRDGQYHCHQQDFLLVQYSDCETRLSAFFTNQKAFGIIALMIILQLILTYVPFMQQTFYTEPLTLLEWGVSMAQASWF